MPLTRPKSRNKSRSPAVASSPLVPAPATPRFLPPSHYAAAAGLAYRSPHEDHDRYHAQAEHGDIRYDYHDVGSLDERSPADNFLPNSMTPHIPDSTSASSGDHAGSRMSFLARKLSRSGSASNKNAGQRQSQIGDLPLVEAQLLPSLRDTIDRMTQPQRTPIILDSPPLDTGALAPNYANDGPGPSKNYSHPHPMAPQASAPSSTGPSSSRLRRPSAGARMTPTVTAPAETQRPITPKTNIPSRAPTTPKTKPKPILKSALKGSSSTSAAYAYQAQPESPSKQSPSKSLRSVRTMFGRKTPQASPPATVAGSGNTVKATKMAKPLEYGAHERSRTDPGRPSKIPSRSAHQSRTPQPTAFKEPRHPENADAGESGSELELRSERGRALFVANAEIVPSSSSSSSNSSNTNQRSYGAASSSMNSNAWRLRVPTAKYGQESKRHPDPGADAAEGIGLGLNMSNGAIPVADSAGASVSYSARDRRGSERNSRHAGSSVESRERAFSPPSRGPRLTVNTDPGRPERYDDGRRTPDILPSPWEEENFDPDSSQQRRRAALLGIVHELETGIPSAHMAYDDYQSESEYSGQHGLAVSDSMDHDVQGPIQAQDRFAENRGELRYSHYDVRGYQSHHSPVANAGQSRCADPSVDRYSWRSSHTMERRGDSDYGTYQQHDDDASVSEYPSEDDEDQDDYGERTPRIVGAQHQPTYPEPQNRSQPPDVARYSPVRAENFASSSRPPSRPQPRRHKSHEATRNQRVEQASPEEQIAPTSRTPRVTFAQSPPSQRDVNRTSVTGSKRRSTFSNESTDLPYASSRSRHSRDNLVTEAYSLRQSSGAAEAQEREAFGLPPSPSSPPKPFTDLPNADSVSSLGSERWQDEGEDFSRDAEAIFERLGGSEQHSRRESVNPRRSAQEPARSSPVSNDKAPRDPDGYPQTSESRPALQQSVSTRSIYEDGIPARPWQQRERDLPALQPDSDSRTWRSTLPPSAYASLLDRYGEAEVQRQQCIWELYERERAFVKRLRIIVQLFIRPLRLQGTKTWVTGVPKEVGRLFDWLEDIINLHAQISSSLHSALTEQYPVVIRVAEVIRRFVPRLEVHQPYIVRVEEVAFMIKKAAAESNSDFGEFVRIQQHQEECEGWTLEAFLAEPVNRLVEYPQCFRRLWEVTPRSHVDHLATFSLLHSTDTMIRTMREVKSREDEYELIKDILNKIEGIPQSVHLANRERRLLARGRLLREYTNDKRRSSGIREQGIPPLGHTSNKYLQLPDDVMRPSVKASPRQSRQVDAAQGRDQVAARGGSTRSTASGSSAFSTASSSTAPITPVDFDPSSVRPWEQSTNPQREHMSSLLHLRLSDTLKQLPIHAFVFSDLIILASPVTSGKQPSDAPRDSWRLLEGVGISRILGVSEDSQRIVLDLLPMDTDDLETGIIPDSAPVTALSLSIPQSSSSGAVLDAPTIRDIRTKWISAFHQCSQHTLRALSFPHQSGKYLAQGPTVDLKLDSSRHSVMALLASGLPLPKSPSIQIQDFVLGKGGDAIQQEREERGWWSLRFQQVLREIQRTDSSTDAPRSLAAESLTTSTSGRKRLGVSRPRQLKLTTISSSDSLTVQPQDGRRR